MNRIEKVFKENAEKGKKAFIAYITAGDPSLESTIRIVGEFDKIGVDIVELGVPFSDPIADGSVNQEASYRALKNNIGLIEIFRTIKEIRKNLNIPIVFFIYFNIILSYGLERFADEAKKSGVDGVLALDLPPEEAEDYKKLMDEREISTIFLVSPVTPPERIEKIAKYSTGFIYYVSQMGVTGERKKVSDTIPEMVGKIRSFTDIPVAVGFGISSPEQVSEISQYADGVIVGSSIVKKIGEFSVRSGFEIEIGKYVETLLKPLKLEQI